MRTYMPNYTGTRVHTIYMEEFLQKDIIQTLALSILNIYTTIEKISQLIAVFLFNQTLNT